MTRDEFIDGYMARSEIDPEYRTDDGFHLPDTPRVIAMECFCGDESCGGWAMVSERSVNTHRELYGTAPDA